MITPMERIEIVFLRSEVFGIVPFLQDQGVVHIEDVPLALDDHPGYLHRVHLPQAKRDDLRALQEVQNLLNEAEPLLATAPSHDAIIAAGRKLQNTTVATLRPTVIEWHRTLRSLSRRRLNLTDNREILVNYRRVLQHIQPVLHESNARLGATARAFVLNETNAQAIDALEKRFVSEVGPEVSFTARGLSRSETAIILNYPESKDAAVDAELRKLGVTTADVPDPALRGVSVEEAMARIEKKIVEIDAKLDELNSQVQVFSEQQGAAFLAAKRLVGDQIAQFTVIQHFAQSEMIGVVHGWVPANQLHALESALKKEFGARATLGQISTKDVEVRRIPTKLENHPIFKPFQLLLGIFDPPKYGSFDPTWLVAVSFVLFYGFILGDFGYGAFIMAVAYWAKRKWSHNEMLSDAMTIAMWMGASSIVWGLIYGEGFGDLPYVYFGYAPFHRGYEPMTLLAIAIGFGLVHVPLALGIGIWQGYKHHDHHHAEEKLGMLLGLIALGVAVVTAAALFPLPATLGYLLAGGLFAGCLFYLYRSMGGMFAMGVMEIIGATANILSYARLMATGIASVVLADLANDILYASPGYWALLAIPVVGVIHVLNIGIGIFSPTIHSLRLNLVEFLPKFYEPEGRNYQPFRKELSW